MKNVYEKCLERFRFILDEFENVYVSFSGGKDSGVLLNLIIKYLRDNNIKRKIGVFHMDYEAQYQQTTDYTDRMLSSNLDIIEPYRICLPLAAQCSTSMYQNYRLPWEEEKKDIWVRKMPDNGINIHNSKLDFFTKGMWDYDLQDKFGGWYKKIKGGGKTACLVGIRTQESLDRWRTIFGDKRVFKYKDKEYSKQIEEDVFNFYPIYDWKTEDVWIANYKFSFDYNKVYDLFYQAGVPLGSMRIASPFNSYATSSLKLYKALDPNNWGKMLLRVNGVNFTGLYGDTTLMGWGKVKLPKGQTWKSYLNFLLSTLPKVSKDNYLNKLKVSKEFRKNKGGVLTDETIAELKKKKIKFEIGKTNVKTSKKPVKMNYLDDIQNVKEFQNIPTYKRMCICILKNDHNCRYMGFGLTKTETEKIQEAMAKYNNIF